MGVNNVLNWKFLIVEVMFYDGMNIEYFVVRDIIIDKVKSVLIILFFKI